MPGSTGTGRPVHFRCARCRKLGGHGSRYGFEYEATGRVRQLTGAQRSCGGRRVAHVRYEYRCLECGHTGWSRHTDVERKWLSKAEVARRVTANDLKERP